MARYTIECGYCGQDHPNPIAAALCCDPAVHDDDWPSINRSSN